MTDSSLSEAAPAVESAAAQPATAGTESQGANTSATPADDNQGAKAPTSVFDAVNAALKPAQGTDEGSPASDSSGNDDPAEGEALSDEITPDELNRYHSRTRRRVQQLIGKNKESAAEIGRLTPLAEQARKINGFVQASGLDWDEVNSGFELMHLMKTNPIEARERLAPIWDALNKACGHELPQDLKQKVDQGYVDEQTARELAQQRARATFATQANQRAAEQNQQRREQAAHEQFGNSVKSSVKEFERNWKTSDPDFAVKHPRVVEKVELTLARMAREGKPLSSASDAVKIIEAAKKAVETDIKPFLKREAINPLPGGGVTANGAPKPRSMAEAVMQGVRM